MHGLDGRRKSSQPSRTDMMHHERGMRPRRQLSSRSSISRHGTMRVKSMRLDGVGWLCSSNPGLKRQGTSQKTRALGGKKSHRRASRRTEAYSAFKAAYVLPQCALRPLYCARALLATTGAKPVRELFLLGYKRPCNPLLLKKMCWMLLTQDAAHDPRRWFSSKK